MNKPSPIECWRLLQAGNQRFATNQAQHPNQDMARRQQAATGRQSDYAYATVLTCADSRVPVEIIFDAGVMDIFTVRVAGNVCDQAVLASIEFGVAQVQTPVLLVLGHTKCGAVAAATAQALGQGQAVSGNLASVLGQISPVAAAAHAAQPDLSAAALAEVAAVANVKQTLANIVANIAPVAAAQAAGMLLLLGGIYDLDTGAVTWLDDEPAN